MVLSLLLALAPALADEPLVQRGAWEGRVDYFMTGAALALNTNPGSGTGFDNNVDTIIPGEFTVRSQDVPAGATLLAAKLWWAGSQTEPNVACSAVPDTQVTLATPGSAAQVVNAQNCYCSDGGSVVYDVIACSADVTSIVGNDLIGDYVVDDYQGRVNNGGTDSAGTSLLLVFEEPSLPTRRVVLYDGNVVLNGDTVTMNLTGFTVDSTPSADLTAFVLEGEVNTGGDTITVDGRPGAAPALSVSDATNPVNDIFNRTINTQGLTDIAGVDIDQFDISSAVQFLDNQLDVTYTATSDKVWVVANVVGVDEFFSQLADRSSKTWVHSNDQDADGDIEPGDTITYTLHLENTGTENATITVTDVIPNAFASWSLRTPLASGTNNSTAGQIILDDVVVPPGGTVEFVVDAVAGSSTCSATALNSFFWSAPAEGGAPGSKTASAVNILIDRDDDGIGDCVDNCPDDPNPDQADGDNNNVGDVCDLPEETCDGTDEDLDGIIDEGFDRDGDQLGDCLDQCPDDPDKTEPGVCDCGVEDLDSDGDTFYNCEETCINDPDKTEPGVCGCGVPDTDTDGDGTPDCTDREVCDGLDNDGDGLVDDEDPSLDPAGQTLVYEDADGDGYGEAGTGTLFCDPPAGWVADDTDCDDANATRNPGLADVCDGIDNDCDAIVDENTECSDDDGDGFTELGGDCNDADEDIRPGKRESCNELDDDCDSRIDEGTECVDDDGDGHCEGGDLDGNPSTLECSDETLPGDCHDGAAGVSPSEQEIPFNGIDDDCDGQVDQEITDTDGDGYTIDGEDCAPSDASAYPGALETADGVDDDCDGIVDEGTAADDIDGDGFCEGADIDGDGVDDCVGNALPGDCVEGLDTVYEGAPEVVDNGVDDDCDGIVDEGSDLTDDDGDGFSEAEGDCDDADELKYPGAEERLNGVDDDCDGFADEFLLDLDGDGWSEADGDCDDGDGWVNPGLAEICDSQDNDCDLNVDEDTCIEEEVITESSSCGCAQGGPPVWLGGLLPLLWIRRGRSAGRP